MFQIVKTVYDMFSEALECILTLGGYLFLFCTGCALFHIVGRFVDILLK